MASDNGKRRGFSRRRFIQGAAAAAAASGSMLSSAAREQEHDEEKHGRRRRPSDDAPDTVFINGKIHTMDDENTVASAVSIRDRSEEHTSELQSLTNLVCRLLLAT